MKRYVVKLQAGASASPPSYDVLRDGRKIGEFRQGPCGESPMVRIGDEDWIVCDNLLDADTGGAGAPPASVSDHGARLLDALLFSL